MWMVIAGLVALWATVFLWWLKFKGGKARHRRRVYLALCPRVSLRAHSVIGRRLLALRFAWPGGGMPLLMHFLWPCMCSEAAVITFERLPAVLIV